MDRNPNISSKIMEDWGTCPSMIRSVITSNGVQSVSAPAGRAVVS